MAFLGKTKAATSEINSLRVALQVEINNCAFSIFEMGPCTIQA